MKHYYFNPKTRDLFEYDTEADEITALVLVGRRLQEAEETAGTGQVARKAPEGPRKPKKPKKAGKAGRVHHCRHCGDAGHRKDSCPKLRPEPGGNDGNLPMNFKCTRGHPFTKRLEKGEDPDDVECQIPNCGATAFKV